MNWLLRLGLLVCMAVCMLAGSATGQATEAAAAHPGISIQLHGDQLAVELIQQDPFEVASALSTATGLRIDGIEVLRGLPTVSFQFEAIPAINILYLLADHADALLRREGQKHYQFGVAGEQSQLETLHAAWESASESDAEALDAAERALLDFIRPAAEGPVLMTIEPWFEAAKRAERADDLPRAESLLREAIVHAQRRDDAKGAEYGRALARLGGLLDRRGDSAQGQILVEQGLALAEAELGPVHADLAGMQATLAAYRKSAERMGEAEDLYRRAIASYGEPETESAQMFGLGRALDGLATLLQQQDRWADSIALLQRSFAVHSAAFGEGGAGFQAWLLGIALFEQDRFAEARAMLQYAVDNDAPGRRNSEALLHLIDLLGAFTAAEAGADQLPALLAGFTPESAGAELAALGGVLQRRASRQHREHPESPDWKTSCAAYAIVSNVEFRDREHTDILRASSASRCEQEILTASAR